MRIQNIKMRLSNKRSYYPKPRGCRTSSVFSEVTSNWLKMRCLNRSQMLTVKMIRGWGYKYKRKCLMTRLSKFKNKYLGSKKKES